MDKNKRILISLTEAESKELDKLADRLRRSRNWIIADALRQYLYKFSEVGK